MKIYTKTGDDGTTALADGRRVPKCDERVETYGELDELNSHLGLVATYTEADRPFLESLQQRLFDLSGWVAAAPNARPPSADDIARLETEIDALEAGIGKAFTGFILPGGTRGAATAHVARTVCRRCERRLLHWLATRPATDTAGTTAAGFLNRLSDYLYVVAKKMNLEAHKNEIKLR